jgi:hypothetical protein
VKLESIHTGAYSLKDIYTLTVAMLTERDEQMAAALISKRISVPYILVMGNVRCTTMLWT